MSESPKSGSSATTTDTSEDPAQFNERPKSGPTLKPAFYYDKAKEYVELHEQVKTSVDMLDSLELFLSTFQKDLSAVSGQISELQERSKDIESRLKNRRKIEKPLSKLLSEITIPPEMISVIIDTDVGEPWLTVIPDFEGRLITSRARARVKAARDLGDVFEAVRIVAATKLRLFFLALLQPIRTSVTTNMQVLQTSILMKQRPLFAFLQRQAPDVALELQRAYVGAARTYYETGFRRYIRSLGWLKARITEKTDTIVSAASEKQILEINHDRLAFAKIEGPGTILAFLADDKSHKEPIESLIRSLLLVLMDNASAEYTFVSTFFKHESFMVESLLDVITPNITTFDSSHSVSESGMFTPRHTNVNLPSMDASVANLKEEQAAADATWKQVIDPVLDYTKTFMNSALEPAPPVVPLLTTIRLTEAVMHEVQARACPPLESFIFELRLKMWPVFQKGMSDHINALKKLSEGATSSYWSRAPATTDDQVMKICQGYVVLFNSFVLLTEQAEETMIFANLQRLRQELDKLISKHTETITDVMAKATKQSIIYETLLQGLNKGIHLTSHPQTQSETAFWAEKEEGARRRIVSVNKGKAPSRGR